uniref:G_PROTEIN_RECEP_F1_2 domain-containing protein n=1 Tax=Macrostomum lignano TaxID=282301 RepID=A0A1I8HH00_9PLAT
LDHIVYFSLSINLMTIVAGNIALLVFVSSRPKSRMTYYITNLGVADLCVGIFCVLPQFIDRVLMQFYGPESLCKMKFFTQTTVSYGAAYALVVLSIDRVDAIANPLRASTSRRSE